jgi:putative flippase GtrA
MIAPLLQKWRRFLLFCLVGASGVIVNLAVFEGGLRLLDVVQTAWRVNLAALAGWAVSVATNFLLNERVTFADTAATWHSSRLQRLARYYAAAATGLVVQLAVLNALLWLLERAPVPHLTAFAWVLAERVRASNLAGIGIGTIANYLMARRWVFR